MEIGTIIFICFMLFCFIGSCFERAKVERNKPAEEEEKKRWAQEQKERKEKHETLIIEQAKTQGKTLTHEEARNKIEWANARAEFKRTLTVKKVVGGTIGTVLTVGIVLPVIAIGSSIGWLVEAVMGVE